MDLKKIINNVLKENISLNNNFKEWFSGSEVVDNNGNPLICYHGSNDKNIEIFDLDLTGKNTDSGMFGKGFYFTDDIKYASTYNRDKEGDVMEVYLKITKPLVIKSKADIPHIEVPNETIEDMENSSNAYSENFRLFLIENNYDGVIVEMSQPKQFVALYPNQIKSTKNDGSWNNNDNNIYS